MSQFTTFESEQLAKYLQASCVLVSEATKLGHWYNAISRACGFRDWNAMLKVAPKIPETQWGEWYGAFFGIARVLIDGQEATNHLIWFRNRDSSRHEVASKLAKSVAVTSGQRVRGINFNYSRPDAPRFDIQTWKPGQTPERSKRKWHETAPIIATSTDQRVKILLWWLVEHYTMAEVYPEKERRFSYQSLSFDEEGTPHTGWASEPQNPLSLTDRFLTELTGVARQPRSCLYVPEVPNGPMGTYFPVVVTEGYREGKPTADDFGDDRWSALKRVEAINAMRGMTKADMSAIWHKFQEYEEPMEEFFEEFGGPYDGD